MFCLTISCYKVVRSGALILFSSSKCSGLLESPSVITASQAKMGVNHAVISHKTILSEQ